VALRPRSSLSAGGRAFEGAFEAAASVAIGVVLGYYADRWLGTEPFLLFFFLVVGSIAGFQRLLRIQVPPATGSPDDRHRADKADGDEKIE
jgi:F0F1-type ATP synthase assembly protein I